MRELFTDTRDAIWKGFPDRGLDMKRALANVSMEHLQAVHTLTPAWSWCFASSWADPKTTSCEISKAIGARRRNHVRQTLLDAQKSCLSSDFYCLFPGD